MRSIIVDDEPLMLRRFVRLSEEIPDLTVVGQFESAKAALEYTREHPVDAAFLDVEMPIKNGVELARELREIRPDILIVFVSAYDDYLWDFNQIGGDYYILKPYSKEILEMAMERIRLLSHRQRKRLYLQMFGRFTVFSHRQGQRDSGADGHPPGQGDQQRGDLQHHLGVPPLRQRPDDGVLQRPAAAQAAAAAGGHQRPFDLYQAGAAGQHRHVRLRLLRLAGQEHGGAGPL